MVPAQETYRVSIATEISEEMVKADTQMRLVSELLRCRCCEQLAQDLTDLYHDLLPILVRASPETPVHHCPWVVHFLAKVLLGRKPICVNDLRLGLTAALFHDSGFAFCKLPRITEAEIADAITIFGTDHPTITKMVHDAAASRLEHSDHSERLVRSALQRFATRFPTAYLPPDVAKIAYLVRRHDHLKIGTLQVQLSLKINQEYVFHSDAPQLLWDHLIADLAWMIDEIETDRTRAERRGQTKKTLEEQLQWNLKCHRDLVKVYECAFPEELSNLNFRNGLPIRDEHTLQLYEELVREVRQRIAAEPLVTSDSQQAS